MSCQCNNHVDPLVPKIAIIKDIRVDTNDVATFTVEKPEGGKCFDFMPGQCAMVSVPPIGEAIFSITSSPTEERFMEFSIKRCGVVTEFIHGLEVGTEIGVRGPYGNNFPVTDELKGKDLLFIAGGIGLAPLRSVINYVMDNRVNYGKVDIVYGARSSGDLVHRKEIFENWPAKSNTDVYLTVDREEEGWDGHVGFVPHYVKDLNFDTNKVALVCGPPIMIKFVLQGLEELSIKRSRCILHWN